MIIIHPFTFNPYQENTYIISDETHECVIIDPGCYSSKEQELFSNYIDQNKLNVKKLLNTHGHIDHMLGNAFVKQRYEVPFITHKLVVPELEATQAYGALMGIHPDPSPNPDQFVDEGDTITFGNTTLEVLFTPGHSAGHISFFDRPGKNLFSGDVLFQGSIGRTDLPGGSFPVLMKSIFDKILPLGDDVKVYCGHGPSTTVRQERVSNMFILNHAPEN
ncbi:MAG: MBL fold metallo-hydrolase [Bacteroidetes bacterium]|nr:MBL fold metallo-hydrolase [Bacteroidota bacterium]